MRVLGILLCLAVFSFSSGCKENSPQTGQASTATGQDNSGTSGTSSGTGQSSDGQSSTVQNQPPPTDTQPPPADSGTNSTPPPTDSGGTSQPVPVEQDGTLALPKPAVAELVYDGPGDPVTFTAALAEEKGDKVTPPDQLWSMCLDKYYADRPDSCAQYSVQAHWKDFGKAIDELDKKEFNDSNVFSAWSEQNYEQGGISYGGFGVQSSIADLPSRLEQSQASRFITTVTEWSGYPNDLAVDVKFPQGALDLPTTAAMDVGTIIRIFGDSADSGRQLLTEHEIKGTGRYYFSLPWDSPYWTMGKPVDFTAVISQSITVTNKP